MDDENDQGKYLYGWSDRSSNDTSDSEEERRQIEENLYSRIHFEPVNEPVVEETIQVYDASDVDWISHRPSGARPSSGILSLGSAGHVSEIDRPRNLPNVSALTNSNEGKKGEKKKTKAESIHLNSATSLSVHHLSSVSVSRKPNVPNIPRVINLAWTERSSKADNYRCDIFNCSGAASSVPKFSTSFSTDGAICEQRVSDKSNMLKKNTLCTEKQNKTDFSSKKNIVTSETGRKNGKTNSKVCLSTAGLVFKESVDVIYSSQETGKVNVASIKFQPCVSRQQHEVIVLSSSCDSTSGGSESEQSVNSKRKLKEKSLIDHSNKPNGQKPEIIAVTSGSTTDSSSGESKTMLDKKLTLPLRKESASAFTTIAEDYVSRTLQRGDLSSVSDSVDISVKQKSTANTKLGSTGNMSNREQPTVGLIVLGGDSSSDKPKSDISGDRLLLSTKRTSEGSFKLHSKSIVSSRQLNKDTVVLSGTDSSSDEMETDPSLISDQNKLVAVPSKKKMASVYNKCSLGYVDGISSRQNGKNVEVTVSTDTSSDESEADESCSSDSLDVNDSDFLDKLSDSSLKYDLCYNLSAEDQEVIEKTAEETTEIKDKWHVNDKDRGALRTPSRGLRYFLPRDVTCRNCQELGHLSRDCSRPRKELCHLCGTDGHWSTRCPLRICFNCEDLGHEAQACQKRRRSKYKICERCRMAGHKKQECPDAWRQYHVTTNGTTPREMTEYGNSCRSCYNCGSLCHWGYECTKALFRKHCLPSYPFVAQYDRDPWKHSRDKDSANAKQDQLQRKIFIQKNAKVGSVPEDSTAESHLIAKQLQVTNTSTKDLETIGSRKCKSKKTILIVKEPQEDTAAEECIKPEQLREKAPAKRTSDLEALSPVESSKNKILSQPLKDFVPLSKVAEKHPESLDVDILGNSKQSRTRKGQNLASSQRGMIESKNNVLTKDTEEEEKPVQQEAGVEHFLDQSAKKVRKSEYQVIDPRDYGNHSTLWVVSAGEHYVGGDILKQLMDSKLSSLHPATINDEMPSGSKNKGGILQKRPAINGSSGSEETPARKKQKDDCPRVYLGEYVGKKSQSRRNGKLWENAVKLATKMDKKNRKMLNKVSRHLQQLMASYEEDGVEGSHQVFCSEWQLKATRNKNKRKKKKMEAKVMNGSIDSCQPRVQNKRHKRRRNRKQSKNQRNNSMNNSDHQMSMFQPQFSVYQEQSKPCQSSGPVCKRSFSDSQQNVNMTFNFFENQKYTKFK